MQKKKDTKTRDSLNFHDQKNRKPIWLLIFFSGREKDLDEDFMLERMESSKVYVAKWKATANWHITQQLNATHIDSGSKKIYISRRYRFSWGREADTDTNIHIYI